MNIDLLFFYFLGIKKHCKSVADVQIEENENKEF